MSSSSLVGDSLLLEADEPMWLISTTSGSQSATANLGRKS